MCDLGSRPAMVLPKLALCSACGMLIQAVSQVVTSCMCRALLHKQAMINWSSFSKSRALNKRSSLVMYFKPVSHGADRYLSHVSI